MSTTNSERWDLGGPGFCEYDPMCDEEDPDFGCVEDES